MKFSQTHCAWSGIALWLRRCANINSLGAHLHMVLKPARRLMTSSLATVQHFHQFLLSHTGFISGWRKRGWGEIDSLTLPAPFSYCSYNRRRLSGQKFSGVWRQRGETRRGNKLSGRSPRTLSHSGWEAQKITLSAACSFVCLNLICPELTKPQSLCGCWTLLMVWGWITEMALLRFLVSRNIVFFFH